MSAVDGSLVNWAMRSPLGERLVRTFARRTLLDRLAAGLFALVVFAGVAYALVKPDYNWDMAAYMATALENRIDDPRALHAETWRLIDEGASHDQQYNLKFSNPYNEHQWKNPDDFKSQLSMYRVKVGYIWLIRALEPVVGLAQATILLSVLPSLVVGLFCLWWLWREDALQGAFILMPLLMLADYTRMTSAVTPDMLLAVLSIAALYLLSRQRDVLAGVLLFASVFVRPDNLILIFALLITSVMFGWRKLPMLITFVASFAGCMAISKLGHHPGWWAHFYFSCVEIQNSMAGFHPDFSIVALLKGYARGVIVALQHNDWPALLALLVAGWALLNKYRQIGVGRTNALAFALAIGALGKFASFPLPDDRFYFVFIAGLAIVLISAWRPRFDVVAEKRVVRGLRAA
jgi:hypothetical protein